MNPNGILSMDFPPILASGTSSLTGRFRRQEFLMPVNPMPTS